MRHQWTYIRFLSHWWPPVAWGLAILAFSGHLGASSNTLALLHHLLDLFPSLSPEAIASLHVAMRKVGHLTAYAILYLLWYRALRFHLPGRPWLTCLAAFGLCALIASLDESRQALSQVRHGSVSDVWLDLTGAALGAFLVPGLWRPAKNSPPPAAWDRGEKSWQEGRRH